MKWMTSNLLVVQTELGENTSPLKVTNGYHKTRLTSKSIVHVLGLAARLFREQQQEELKDYFQGSQLCWDQTPTVRFPVDYITPIHTTEPWYWWTFYPWHGWLFSLYCGKKEHFQIQATIFSLVRIYTHILPEEIMAARWALLTWQCCDRRGWCSYFLFFIFGFKEISIHEPPIFCWYLASQIFVFIGWHTN